MFKEIKEDIKRIDKSIKDAIEKDKMARKAYLDSAQNSQSHVNEKIKELEVELEETKSKNNHLPQELSEALSIADIDQAVKIEEEIKRSNEKMQQLKHKITLLTNASLKGDSDLYYAAIEAYRNIRKQLGTASQEIRKLNDVLKKLSQELEESKQAYEDTSRTVNSLLNRNRIDEPLIAMVESFEGAIDITGHTCGSTFSGDMNAKMRYIRGNINGIENTVAGKKLRNNQ